MHLLIMYPPVLCVEGGREGEEGEGGRGEERKRGEEEGEDSLLATIWKA